MSGLTMSLRLMQSLKHVLAEARIVRFKFLGPYLAQWSGGLRRWSNLDGCAQGAFPGGCREKAETDRWRERDRQWNRRMLLRDLEAELRDYGRTLTAVRSEAAIQRKAQLKKSTI